MKNSLALLTAVTAAMMAVACSEDHYLEKDALGAKIVLSAPGNYVAACEENLRLWHYFNAFSDSHLLLTCFIADEAMRKMEAGGTDTVHPILLMYVAGIRGDVSPEQFNAMMRDFSTLQKTKEVEVEAKRLMAESDQAISQVAGKKTETDLDLENFIEGAQRPFFKLKKASCFTFDGTNEVIENGKPAKHEDVTALCMALIKKRSLTFKATMASVNEQSRKKVNELALDSMQKHFSINGGSFE